MELEGDEHEYPSIETNAQDFKILKDLDPYFVIAHIPFLFRMIKTTALLLLTCVILISGPLKSQDTLSVYFEFGDAKIQYHELPKLDAIATNYDLFPLDSIQFIGVADSVGNFRANKRLSEKRAKNVAKYCGKILPRKTIFTIQAIGEQTDRDQEKNRRVDVVLFSQTLSSESSETVEDNPETEADACYYILDNFLNASHIRTVTKRKKEFMVIEVMKPKNIPKDSEIKYIPVNKRKYYHGSTNKNGEFTPVKLKWSERRTGTLWWAEKRFVAAVPKIEFDRYKIFQKKGNSPCIGCLISLQATDQILPRDSSLTIDRFLLANTQYKTIFFNRDKVKIRCPREYVNLDEKYFMMPEPFDEVKWKTKWGIKNKNYYHSKLPVKYNKTKAIGRYMPVPCKPKNNNGWGRSCGTCFGYPNQSFVNLAIDAGSFYLKSEATPYITLEVSRLKKHSQMSLGAGTIFDSGFIANTSYQYHFKDIPYVPFFGAASWSKASSPKVYKRYGQLYIGTDLNLIAQPDQASNLQQYAHLGFAHTNLKEKSLIPRIYVQYGLSTNYLGENLNEINPLLQFGINIGLVKLYPNSPISFSSIKGKIRDRKDAKK